MKTRAGVGDSELVFERDQGLGEMITAIAP
jgi:hypothetical protein